MYLRVLYEFLLNSLNKQHSEEISRSLCSQKGWRGFEFTYRWVNISECDCVSIVVFWLEAWLIEDLAFAVYYLYLRWSRIRNSGLLIVGFSTPTLIFTSELRGISSLTEYILGKHLGDFQLLLRKIANITRVTSRSTTQIFVFWRSNAASVKAASV